jgi:hypothetical protein
LRRHRFATSRKPLNLDAGILFNDHVAEDGPTVFEHVCGLDAEGIVSKRIDSKYRAGRGSRRKTQLTSRCSAIGGNGGNDGNNSASIDELSGSIQTKVEDSIGIVEVVSVLMWSSVMRFIAA